ncbi:MAG: DUF4838 domain-containing protein [Chloroflexi bacterium]|nr:DUF4838 domain-containing protein [Chloroflexota bacterium]
MNTIYVLGNDVAVAYAAREFARYAKKIASVSLPIRKAKAYTPDAPGIWLGVCAEFTHGKWPKLTPSKWDDGYALKRTADRAQQLLISGTNGRSVLFGVYHYFEHLGARWVRPGPHGELLPSMTGLPIDERLDVTETASYRHRGVCIEGSPSLEHTVNMVDWMAKRRMNSFFLQFRHSGTFWDRWYSRAYNPYYGKPAQLSEADYRELDQKVIAEVKRRGLLLHQVGHGWTAATVGLPHNGWQTTDQEVEPAKKRWLAKLNGQRQLFHQIPINTELCYSYKPAFQALLDTICTYATEHPEVDVLHFWLSDAMNNKCECKHCATLSPADWYARLVNALSERLYQIDPERRFVFLSYFESWWAPEQTVIEGTYGNAILMFAPITRCFRHGLTAKACDDDSSHDGASRERPPLNHAGMPRTNKPFTRLLGKWWEAYTGDSFLFDYYLWSGLHTQVSDVSLAKVIHDDMYALKSLGLSGYVSCQVLRSFWPTGLSMAAMAETTWNRKLRWQALKAAHFQAAYGADAEWVETYLNHLEKLLLGQPQHGGTERLETKPPKQLRALDAFLQAHHVELGARAERASEPVYRESLELLAHMNQFLLMKCQVVLGKTEPSELKQWLLKSERAIHPFLDVPALAAMQIKE